MPPIRACCRGVVADPVGDLDPFATPDPAAAIVAEHALEPGSRRLLALTTSGTSTGRPRVIRRSTSSWVDSFEAFSRLSDTRVTSRVWIPGPLRATMNLFAATHAHWAGAARVESAAEATHLHLTTAALLQLLDTDAHAVAGRTVVTAGAALVPAVADRVEAAGGTVHHYYGAAELSFVAWGRDSSSMRAFPGVEVRTVEHQLQARSPFVAGPAPDATTWHTVGDLGEVRPDGLITVWGRPGAITTAGATVQIGEIEAALRDLAPHGLVVQGLPHPRLGEVVTAWVTDASVIPALKERSRARLTAPAQPRQWRVIPTWPLTPAGKIDRPALLSS